MSMLWKRQDCEVNNKLICQTSMNTPILDLKAQINELKESIAHFGQKQPDSNTSSNLNQLSKNKNFNVQSVRQNRFSQTYTNQRNHHGRSNRSRPFQQCNHQSTFRSWQYSHTQESADTICQFRGKHGHSCRFCPSFSNYFIPKNSISENQFLSLPPRPTDTTPCSSRSLESNEQFNNLNSDLKPNAAPFQMSHPNWWRGFARIRHILI